ncbi:hypothetical protein [Natrinema salifodinae]|uniref:Uncharacterized protein n=1 Tax=Natrinema salifodinae TaxID=1202768 RepID=A0A1I0N0Z4_9EURY|nr:hypothetical protein [Natrinema salifodinae]SEV94694.1 hypothetical protein SAMN05216285_1224 [Natrinema salifodinae]
MAATLRGERTATVHGDTITPSDELQGLRWTYDIEYVAPTGDVV